MHRVLALLVLIAAALSPAVVAAQGNLSRGRDLAEAHRCLTCHSSGTDPGLATAPYLAGQKLYYLQKQLAAFRMTSPTQPVSNQRVVERAHEIMGVEASVLSDLDIANLAEYFANMPCLPRRSDVPPITNAPPKAQRCTYCHGVTGVNPYAIVPNIGGQKKIYLVEQLTALRGSALDQSAGPDYERFHRMMAPSVFDLNDGEIEGLADFYSKQSCRVDRLR
jgi:cytochrome c553